VNYVDLLLLVGILDVEVVGTCPIATDALVGSPITIFIIISLFGIIGKMHPFD